jgi:hypothetical protein
VRPKVTYEGSIVLMNGREKEIRLVRTSHTHPLRINTLPLANGQLGITFCPGKKGDSVYGAAWDRDLDLDIDAIKAWGASAVLTLLEDHEFKMLSVANLGDALNARGIESRMWMYQRRKRWSNGARCRPNCIRSWNAAAEWSFIVEVVWGGQALLQH